MEKVGLDGRNFIREGLQAKKKVVRKIMGK